MNNSEYYLVRKHTRRNFREVTSSASCGCLSCARIFAPTTIVEWVEHCNTAVCPYCEEKTVIGSASGFPITDEFFAFVNDYEGKPAQTAAKTKQVSYKYQSSFSLPSILDKSVTFPGLADDD